MFKVVINDGQTEMPTDDVYYVIAKEGIFLKKTIGVMDSVAPVDKISTLESVAASARMRIEKIPGPKFAKVIEFFREVYHRYYAEAIVLLFYDEKNKIHTIIPPQQKVSGGSCDYNRGITIEGLTMIGTIHSHGSMSAFHSGVDDKDEETFDGLHITLGNMRDEEISISASIVANGYRIMVDPGDYVNQLRLTQDIDEEEEKATTTVYKMIGGKLVKDEKQTSRYTYKSRKYDKRYVATVTDHQKQFNKKWMKMVEKGTYRWTGAHYGVNRSQHPGAFQNSGWGYNYDSDAWGRHQPWRRQQNLPSTIVKGKVHPQNVGPYKTAGITFPPHEHEDANPCANCTYRDEKIEWAIEQYTEEIDGPDEDQLTNHFMLDDKFDDMFNKDQTASINIICGKCKLKYNLGLTTVCPGCGEQAPDEIDMKEVDLTPIDPVIGNEFVCPICGNTFTHKGKDECPFCQEELDFADHRKVDSTPSDEEIEVGAEGNLEVGQGYSCLTCRIGFIAEHEVEDCPHCKNVMINGYNCSPYSMQKESEEISKTDSGEFLHDHGDGFFQKVALDAAAEEDETLERLIPDPEKEEIPLSRRRERRQNMSLRKMFKRAFGGGK